MSGAFRDLRDVVSENQNDPSYDPNKDLDDDEGHDIGPEEDDEGEEGIDESKRWRRKVQAMTDNWLMSERICTICEILFSIQAKDATTRVVMFSKFVKFLDIINVSPNGWNF